MHRPRWTAAGLLAAAVLAPSPALAGAVPPTSLALTRAPVVAPHEAPVVLRLASADLPSAMLLPPQRRRAEDDAEETPPADTPSKAPGKRVRLDFPWWTWAIAGGTAAVLGGLACLCCWILSYTPTPEPVE